jgi:hypothetical protein
MKRTVRVAILGAMLHGSAHAAEPNASIKPALDKGQAKGVVQPAVVSSKKNKVARKKAQAVEPVETVKNESPAVPATTTPVQSEKPAATTEQSIQLKGVRG